jgi:diguanylate cyclase (GGDEF)-like protein
MSVVGSPVLTSFLLLAAGLCVCLGLMIARRRRDVLTRQFSLFMLAAAFYAAGYAWELNSASLVTMKLALRFEYLGAPFATAFWVMLAYGYLWQRQMRPAMQVYLLIIPVITLGMVLTNDLHHLFYADLQYARVDGMSIARIRHGPWYGVHLAYVNTCFLAGNFFLLRAWRSAQLLYRRQAVLMLIASFMPWASYMVYLAGFSPYGIDLTPFSLSLTGLAVAIAVWYLGFLNIVPVARDTVLECIRDGVIVLDTHNRIIDFNSNAGRMFPALRTRSLGLLAQDIVDLRQLEGLARHNRSLRLRRERQTGWESLELSLHPLIDDHGIKLGAVVTVSDITLEVAAEEKLWHQANRDALTGVGNRHYLMEQSERAVCLALRHMRPLAALVIDLDFFKQTNDEQGHLAGDEQLRAVATMVQTRLRQTDIIGRFGGDEFVATLPETSLHMAVTIAADLLAAVGAQLGVSLSIGVAALTPSHKDFESLLGEADKNLYLAKEAGRGCVSAGPTWAGVD